MTNEEIQKYIEKRWNELCRNALWFKGDIEKMFLLGLQSALKNLIDARIIEWGKVTQLDPEIIIEQRYPDLEHIQIHVWAQIKWNRKSSSLDQYQIALECQVEDHRHINTVRKKRALSRWDMIAEEIQYELPLSEEKHKQKDRKDSRNNFPDGDVPTGMPLKG